jgi:hypothetical protein
MANHMNLSILMNLLGAKEVQKAPTFHGDEI